MNILRWWSGLLLAFALVALVRVFLPLPFANEIMIFSIYTIGCNFLLGRVGFISFGQPAYLAVGAYAAAFYLYYFGTNPYVGILIGIAAGIVVSLAVGPMFVRLRSDYFALVNLALAVIIFYLMQKVLADITHGDNGLWFLTNLSSTPVLDLTRPDQFFIFAFLVGFAVWAFYKYLDDSIYGACCLAPRSTTTSCGSSATTIFKYVCWPSSSPTQRPRWPARCMPSISVLSARKSPARRVPPIRWW